MVKIQIDMPVIMDREVSLFRVREGLASKQDAVLRLVRMALADLKEKLAKEHGKDTGMLMEENMLKEKRDD